MVHHKKHYRKHSLHKTKAEAEAEARRLRARGEHVRIRRDPLTGRWIVELIVLIAVAGLALGILGGLRR